MLMAFERLTKTLETLDLQYNGIGQDAATVLADALRNCIVSIIVTLRVLSACLFSHVETENT